jgi:membrane-bound lytic murein transglycosylase MltF
MSAKTILEYREVLKRVANAIDCDWEILAGQLMQESSGDPDAVGDAGQAWGLGQIHMVTMYNHEFAQGWKNVDLLDPEKNLRVYEAEMLRLSRWLKNKYDIESDLCKWCLVAWNWGCGHVMHHLDAGKGWDELPVRVKDYWDLCNKRGRQFENEPE